MMKTARGLSEIRKVLLSLYQLHQLGTKEMCLRISKEKAELHKSLYNSAPLSSLDTHQETYK